MSRIPAVIVSGYLGSGKTTLVGRMLESARAEGVRLAILSNEFGDTGIDRALLDAGEDGIVELDGGCVCCRLSDALGETVERLIERARPDRLVVETSGVALPGEILIQFWRPPISALVRDAAVVVLVDAARLASGELVDDETFLEQVEAADVLVLTKVDLVDAAGEARARDRLAALVPDRDVNRATYGDIDLSALFPPDPDGARAAREDPDAVAHEHTHEQFGTDELVIADGASDDEVLAAVRATDCLRAKGFFRGAHGMRLVQGVGARVEIIEAPLEPPAALVGRVVVIRKVG
jgi:cobalamin biosynthesis protein CobW